jgi:hypothetical protein
MPLAIPALSSGLEAVASGPGSSVHDCATGWADACKSYALGVVPPSSAVAAASSTLASAFEAAFASGNAAAGMQAALTAWAAAVGVGMAPAFVAVPPPDPPDLASLFAPPFAATHALAAARVSTALDGWLRGATSTPAAGGAASPWA